MVKDFFWSILVIFACYVGHDVGYNKALYDLCSTCTYESVPKHNQKEGYQKKRFFI